jgi:hypothetical protein
MKTQLLLTFTGYDYIDDVIENIKSVYELSDDRIFVLVNKRNPKEAYLTYNVVKKNYVDTPSRTILVHRKKETNTLYTINAVNQAILDEVGVYDHSYDLNWNQYKNSLLLTDDYGLRRIYQVRYHQRNLML